MLGDVESDESAEKANGFLIEEFAGPCKNSWSDKKKAVSLPSGKFVKILPMQTKELRICEVQVYGIKAGGDIPAGTAQIDSLNIMNGKELRKQLTSPMKVDASQGLLIRSISNFNVDEIDAGIYDFNLISSDGTLLFIDGQLILSNDGVHPLTAMTALAQLDPGPHQLTLLYFKKEGGKPALKLQWEGGPYKFRRQTFKFNVDWAKLRVTKAVPTCKTQPPAANPEGVPIVYGLDQCHITCKDCLRGSQASSDTPGSSRTLFASNFFFLSNASVCA